MRYRWLSTGPDPFHLEELMHRFRIALMIAARSRSASCRPPRRIRPPPRPRSVNRYRRSSARSNR